MPNGRRAGSAAQDRARFAQTGVYLGDGASDVPYSQQQRDRLVLRRQELETEMLQQSSSASQLAGEVTEERDRLERIGHSTLSLPADHVVWSVSASPGSTVTEGQTILDLADCAHRFVVVDLPEREFEQIKASEAASVRLIGSDEWRSGRVRQVLGSAARTDDRLLAAQIPHPTSSSISVEVELPRMNPRRNVMAFAISVAWPKSDSSERGLGSRIGPSKRLRG